MKRRDKNDHQGHGHSIVPSSGSAARYLNRAFILGIVLNLIFVFVEFAAGFILDSVALMSDAGHNLSDVASLALALFAFRLAARRPTDSYTYGRKKSTILVSLTNACLLLVAVGFILVESVEKLIDPQPVQGGLIAVVAGVGIVINAFTAWLFMRHKGADLNVKGAYLHMIADTLVSVGVLVSGVIISFTGWYIVDPVIGIIVAVVILVSTWGLLKDSIRLSLDGVPRSIDVAAIKKAMMGAHKDIVEIHHVHVWAISTTENAITAHIVTEENSDAYNVKYSLKKILKEHGISHITLEFESSGEARNEDCGLCE